MLSRYLCPKCSRSVEPLERVEKDVKTRKTWLILYCPFERCAFNIDIRPCGTRVWNGKEGRFEGKAD